MEAETRTDETGTKGIVGAAQETAIVQTLAEIATVLRAIEVTLKIETATDGAMLTMERAGVGMTIVQDTRGLAHALVATLVLVGNGMARIRRVRMERMAESKMMLSERKESESPLFSNIMLFDRRPRTRNRISPGNSRRATPTPSTSTRAVSPSTASAQKKPEPEPDLELQLEGERDAAREAEAARLARRQAIRAKLALMSDGKLTAGASPGSSSAVQQPPSTPSESNPTSQNHSAAVTPGIPLSASHSKYTSQSLFCSANNFDSS